VLIYNRLKDQGRLRELLSEANQRVQARVDALLGYPRLRREFRRRVGYELDLDHPRTNSEKVQWRKVHDRNPLFPVLADKLRVRDYAAERLGRARADAVFPRLYLVTDRPETVDFGRLPDDLVIKANHASGWNIFLRAGEPVDHELVRRECRKWLRRGYGVLKHEWAYLQIPRRVLFEESLLTAEGKLPDDIKLFMYHGVCRRCAVETGRGVQHQWRHYTADWKDADPPGRAEESPEQVAPLQPRPQRFDAMLEVAERLSAGIDYLRVDFLDLGDRFVLTELTLYPGSGFGTSSFERGVETGKHWTRPEWRQHGVD
jgi:hypothetical protein